MAGIFGGHLWQASLAGGHLGYSGCYNDIVYKLRAIIADNASLNNILCYTIKTYIEEKEDKE